MKINSDYSEYIKIDPTLIYTPRGAITHRMITGSRKIAQQGYSFSSLWGIN